MAGKTFYSCTLSVGGNYVANLKEITVETNMDTHESSDLSSDWVTTERGIKRWTATARTEFNGANFPLISQLDSQNAELAIAIANRNGTTIFAGNGWINRANKGGGEGIGMGDLAITGDGAPTTIY